MKSPWFVDTTLRDGEQAPGVAFSSDQAFSIAEKLAAIGIPELEIGTPAMGPAEIEKMRRIARAHLGCRTTAWCRADERDIDAAVASGVDAVHLSFPMSDIHLNALLKNRAWVLERAGHLVTLAKERFGYVSVGAQDASRAPKLWLRSFGRLVADLGAARLRIADTVGIWEPTQCHESISKLRAALPDIEIGVHTHDDLGMATANAVVAARAGADAVDVTVNGLGERAGNAALEEVVMAVEVAWGVSSGLALDQLMALSQLVEQCSGRSVHRQKAVVGKSAFEHESGIHVHAMLRDARSYQPFAPQRLGRGRSEFVIGKHSGRAALAQMLTDRGQPASPAKIEDLRERLLRHAEGQADPLTHQDLESLVTAG